MVECDLAKVEVAGSNPVSRSSLRSFCRRRLSTVARRMLTRAKVDYSEAWSFGWEAKRTETRPNSPLENNRPALLIGAVAKW